MPVKKSVFPDYIVCLEDGKKLKMLKRHLRTAYNMTPEEYRERWGLPADYPMVAPNYAAPAQRAGQEDRPRHRGAPPALRPAGSPARQAVGRPPRCRPAMALSALRSIFYTVGRHPPRRRGNERDAMPRGSSSSASTRA